MAAKKAKLVDVDDIDLLGKKADEKKLALYAEQNGAAAVPFLERAVKEGAVGIRAAAVRALAKLDAARAIALVDDALTALGKKPPKKEQKALFACLLSIGTDDAIDRWLASQSKSLALSNVDDADLAALAARIARGSIDAAVVRAVRLERFQRATLDDPAELVAVLVDETVERYWRDNAARSICEKAKSARRQFADALAAVRDASTKGTVSSSYGIQAILALDPDGAPAQLAQRFRTDSTARASIIAAVSAGDARFDGFVDDALAIASSDVTSALALLVRIGSERAKNEVIAWAARVNALDDAGRRVLHALGALGDVRGAPILLAWLAKPEGKDYAPMLLTALGGAGNAMHADALAALKPSDPARVRFYEQAEAQLRARG